MMREKDVKRQLKKFEKLLGEHNKQRKRSRRNYTHNYIFEEGLFFGAWLAYDSVLYGKKET